MWVCANCGEQIEESFEACWNCQYGRDGTLLNRPEEIVEEANAVLEAYLQPNEFLRHWAYGIEPMPVETKLLLFLLGALVVILAPLSVQAIFFNRIFEINRIAETGLASKMPTIILFVT